MARTTFNFDIDESSNYKSNYRSYVPSQLAVYFSTITGKYEGWICCFDIYESHPNTRKSKAKLFADKVKRDLKSRGYTFEDDKDPDYLLRWYGFNKEKTHYANIDITDYPEFGYCYVLLHFGYH